ncbi:energy transducer TonB [Rhodoferax sp.]|uniref:energy transducer TonB n=1 Tax=Rhodoferax sp. TaxID=50421 RepID=UPI002768FC6B|nr:TonB family protein [Rhodoferax sp.]
MILRNAAVPGKTKSATTPIAAAPRQNTSKQSPDSSVPARPPEPAPAPTAAATPIATPPVQAVEAAAPTTQAPTPPMPASVAAMTTNPTPMPAAVATKTALVLIKNDPPTLSGPLARESPTGVVRVAFNVNPDGSTSDFKIAASNNRRLNSAVLAAISKWRYQPIDAVQATEVEMVFSND